MDKDDILYILRAELPKEMRNMEIAMEAMRQQIANAADEIEKLREENRALRKGRKGKVQIY